MVTLSYEKSRHQQRRADDHYRARRRKRQLADLPPAERYSVARIFSRENLVHAAHELIRFGGLAPGPDQIRPNELTPSEIGQIAQAVSESILAGTYRPHKTRPHDIPKADSDEMRRLQIANFFDRVVSKALHDAISPLVDPLFLRMSYGFRPGRNTWQLLADLKIACEAENTWVLAIEDVRKAFDSVVIDDVLAAHRKLLEQHVDDLGDYSRLLSMIEKVLRGHHPQRRLGIDQGSPYSPTALNVYLHTIHDVPLTRDATKPFWIREEYEPARYADNLVYRVQSVEEGKTVLDHVTRLLKAKDLDLKGTGGVFDLAAGDKPSLLGFTLRQATEIEVEMQVEPAATALVGIQQHLMRCHELHNPVDRARQVLEGWVAYMGPAFGTGVELLPEIGLLAANLGLREAVHQGRLEYRWEASWGRWRRQLQVAADQYHREPGEGAGA